MKIERNLAEFLTLERSQGQSHIEFVDLDESEVEGCAWNHTNTKIFISLYKLYKSKVGTSQLKNYKKLWELLAHILNKKHNLNFTAGQVENRWRVLERNYKKVKDNNNKTGRGRKNFEFEQEMDEIFGKKRNINPKILLSSATIAHPTDLTINEEHKKEEENYKSNDNGQVQTTENTACNTMRKRKKKNTANEVLEKMRHDKLKFYENKIKILQERNEIEKEKLMEIKGKNDLIEARNYFVCNSTK
ncbi:hypothetical protein ABEB36_010828 [Hypothenemus hampei]|uniref:Myb/SANT-like DNA-binding domain-containing protein n=1 Tax=Hypothenemus hampei TaxID=57062 RepID=A0ABD1ED66_HYPHA